MEPLAPQQQYGALAWRVAGSRLEILLISSRQTRRWVIPKGWPIAGLSPSRSAAREAFEEAGIKGRTVTPALGDYHYRKRLGGGAERDCRVDVFALSVEKQCEKWPEQAERVTRWFPAGEAAEAVAEPGLAALIRRFAAGLYRRYA